MASRETPAGDGTHVRVLGRPRIVDPTGVEHGLRGRTQAGLLGLFVARRGRPVSRDVIEAELWPDGHVSETAARVTVGRLRRRLVAVTGFDVISSDHGTYTLDLDDDEIDVGRFRAAFACAHRAWEAGEAEAVGRHATTGEALWRGRAYEGVEEIASVAPEQTRLDEERRELRDLHAASLLTSGRARDSLEVLGSGSGANSYRVSSRSLRVAALHALDRQADALAAYEDLRRLFERDLAGEPASRLAELGSAVARGAAVAEVVRLALPNTPAGPVKLPRAERPSGEPSLVGRHQELTIGTGLVTDRDPRVWVIEAPAGFGKSRLANAIGEQAAEAGLTVIRAGCRRGVGSGMVILRQLMAGLAGPGSVALDAAVGPEPAASFPELASSAPTAAAVANRVGSRSERPAPPPVTAEIAEARLFSAVERAVADAPPALVIVDDTHWLDDRVADLLAPLVVTPGPVRWLFPTRPCEPRSAAMRFLADLARGGARFDTLEPLDDRHSRMLARTATQGRSGALSNDAIHEVVVRSGGIPFAVIELARHVDGGGTHSAVPATVDAVIGAELAGLDEASSAVAEAVAVAGRPHSTEVVMRAAEVSRRAAASVLDRVVGAGLVATDEGRAQVWPRHDLVREAVTARMLDSTIRETHHRLADALESTDGSAVLQLEHLLESGDATASEVEAAAAAALHGPTLQAAPQDAATLGRALVKVTGAAGRDRDEVATRLCIASALFAIGDPGGARSLLAAQRSALDALQDPVLDALALVTEGAAAVSAAESLARWQRAESVLDQLPASEEALTVRLSLWASQAAMHHDMARARELARLASDRLGPDPEPWLRVSVLTHDVALGMAFDASADELDETIDAIGVIATTTGDPLTRAIWAMSGIERAMRSGTADDVATKVDEVYALATPAQRVEARWWALAARAALDLVRGDLAGASTSYLEAMEFGAGRSVEMAMPLALLHRFELDHGTGRLADFHALLPPPTRDNGDGLLVAQAHFCLAANDEVGARSALDLLAVDHLVAEQPPGTWAVIASLGASAAARVGHRRLGAVIAADLVDREAVGLTCVGLAYVGSVELARGLAETAAGRRAEGLDLLRVAVEREVRFGSPAWIARAARAAADAHELRARSGDGREAARLRRQADSAEASVILP